MKKRLTLIGAIVAAVIVVSAGVWFLLTRNQVSTDDAQIDADVVPVAARISGQIKEVRVSDNAQVKAGEVLFVLDAAGFMVHVDQAKAELATAEAQEKTAVDQVAVANAGLAKALADLHRLRTDVRRGKKLRSKSVISPEALDNLSSAEKAGSAGVDQASAQRDAAAAQHKLALARVQAAQAALDLARLQLGYTQVTAATDGYVSKLSARAGQLIQAGQAVAELVPLTAYVVANFKETQIGKMRPGQRARITIDAYPKTKLEGRVESLSAGTGARFALLPPDNATGNFVKVVQRLPVRIRLENPPEGLPLRAGLSADVTVVTK